MVKRVCDYFRDYPRDPITKNRAHYGQMCKYRKGFANSLIQFAWIPPGGGLVKLKVFPVSHFWYQVQHFNRSTPQNKGEVASSKKPSIVLISYFKTWAECLGAYLLVTVFFFFSFPPASSLWPLKIWLAEIPSRPSLIKGRNLSVLTVGGSPEIFQRHYLIECSRSLFFPHLFLLACYLHCCFKSHFAFWLLSAIIWSRK